MLSITIPDMEALNTLWLGTLDPEASFLGLHQGIPEVPSTLNTGAALDPVGETDPRMGYPKAACSRTVFTWPRSVHHIMMLGSMYILDFGWLEPLSSC